MLDRDNALKLGCKSTPAPVYRLNKIVTIILPSIICSHLVYILCDSCQTSVILSYSLDTISHSNLVHIIYSPLVPLTC